MVLAQEVALRGRTKPYIISSDCHVIEPPDLFESRIDEKFRHRLPRVELRDGVKYMVVEGHKPQRVMEFKLEGLDLERSLRGSRDPEERLRDHDRDGIDAEVIYPSRGLTILANEDPEFQMAQAKVYNDWAHEVFSPHFDRLMPAPIIPVRDVQAAIAEVRRVAKMGYRALFMPALVRQQPYNLPVYDPLWAEVQDIGLPICFHVGTGFDPRIASGPGGAIFNYAIGALGMAQDTIARFCTSGVCDRFPTMRFGVVESGIGWVPWLLHAMDEANTKHHFWVRPKLQLKPSEYFLRQGFACFQDDPVGLAHIDLLENNILWGNDYPHHEGTWPYSQQVISDTMAHLTEEQKRKVIGLNAAKLFKFPVPTDRA
jgi:predicted TIM-barrel fold metal-dependent hydrolase